jgi:hypothetical protein
MEFWRDTAQKLRDDGFDSCLVTFGAVRGPGTLWSRGVYFENAQVILIQGCSLLHENFEFRCCPGVQ